MNSAPIQPEQHGFRPANRHGNPAGVHDDSRLRLRRLLTCVVVASVTAATLVVPGSVAYAAGAGGAPPDLQVLHPGFEGWFVQPLRVNVVFVGYEAGSGPRDVDPARLLSGLPSVTASFADIPLEWGRVIPAHVAFELDYRLRFAHQEFEDAFFSHLGRHSRPRALTSSRSSTTAIRRGRSTSPRQSRSTPPPSRTGWRTTPGPGSESTLTNRRCSSSTGTGVPTSASTFTASTPAPTSTLASTTAARDPFKMIAYGGTPSGSGPGARRVWFHDLSAGPDTRTLNGNLSQADVDRDGEADYRLPPVWEYGNAAGYRPFDDLSGDLGKLVRYVAVDMLFAPSPTYPPVISAPEVPSRIDVTVNRFLESGTERAALSTEAVAQHVAALQPWNTFTVTERQQRMPSRLTQVLGCYETAWSDPTFRGDSCYGGRDGWASHDLFHYVTDHCIQLTDRSAELSIPAIVVQSPLDVPFSAMAEPDYRNGSQSHIFQIASPENHHHGGSTRTLTHEVGHHLGLSHPHSGLDFESGSRILPYGPFHFLWTGDESASVMSYLRVSDDFSQFELDAMARWMAAGYLNQSNQVLARILASPRARRADADVRAADAEALESVIAFGVTDYRTAAFRAKAGYDRLVRAADDLSIPIEPQAEPADMKAHSPNRLFVDPVGTEHDARLRGQADEAVLPGDIRIGLRSVRLDI